MKTTLEPTDQTYSELQYAYAYYNEKLFGGQLPDCLITLQRKNRARGYYCRDSFTHQTTGENADEIALNPHYFALRRNDEVLSTLAHEMVHLKQYRFGQPGRGRYHNKQWADWMEGIGLCPSSTGKPGGNRTGDSMTHYIVSGGRFEVVTAQLLNQGFGLSWAEYVPDAAATDSGHDMPSVEVVATTGNRWKYTCPSCALNAWAKPHAALVCGDCDEDLISENDV